MRRAVHVSPNHLSVASMQRRAAEQSSWERGQASLTASQNWSSSNSRSGRAWFHSERFLPAAMTATPLVIIGPITAGDVRTITPHAIGITAVDGAIMPSQIIGPRYYHDRGCPVVVVGGRRRRRIAVPKWSLMDVTFFDRRTGIVIRWRWLDLGLRRRSSWDVSCRCRTYSYVAKS